ncbi:MAG: HEAT repeat domain-containing protein [Ignavibacteriales bacterium]|nr:HEAT repeat domain-containing protein [Ignavibacteriales bacterium]
MTDDVRSRIARLLSDADADVRRQAAEELENDSGLASIAALSAALGDESKGVRDVASRSLLTIGGVRVASGIVEYIADTNIVTRNLASELLVQLGDAAVQALQPYLHDKDRDIRKFAVDILGLIGNPSTVDNIISLLRDGDENVAISAIEALGNIKSRAAIGALKDVFSFTGFSGASVAEAFGKIGDEESAEYLLVLFSRASTMPEADPLVRFALIEALAQCGRPSALTGLYGSLRTAHGKLWQTTMHAIVSICERSGESLQVTSADKEQLLSMVGTAETEVSASAVKALAHLAGDDVTTELLQQFGRSEDLDQLLTETVRTRHNVFVQCTAALEKNSGRGKRQLITLLGELARQYARNLFSAHATDISLSSMNAATDAVMQQWHSADLDTQTVILNALFYLDGDRAIQFLETTTDDLDQWQRVQCIELLGSVSDRRVPTFLQRFLSDEDEMVRSVSANTLESLGFAPEAGR